MSELYFSLQRRHDEAGAGGVGWRLEVGAGGAGWRLDAGGWSSQLTSSSDDTLYVSDGQSSVEGKE